MRSRRGIDPRLSGALVVALVVVAVAMAVGAVASARSVEPDVSGAQPIPRVPESHALLVVGDSWTTGGPTNTGPEWPWLIDRPDNWVVIADAVGGTGYVGAGTVDNSGIMSGRLDALVDDYRPDAAVIALGRNDVSLPTDEVLPVARKALTTLAKAWPDATIVVLSPFSPDLEPDAGTVALTEGLSEIAADLGLDYVDVSRVIGEPDRQIKNYHPTDAGQRAIADAVGPQLADLFD